MVSPAGGPELEDVEDALVDGDVPYQRGTASAAFRHRHAFFNFIRPQHARGHDLGGFQRLAQVAFRFTIVLVVKHAEIESQQWHAKNPGGGLGGKTFAAALNSQQ